MPEPTPITSGQMRELCNRVADNCTRDLLLVFVDYVGRLEKVRDPGDVVAILSRLSRIEGEAKIEGMPKVVDAVHALRKELE